VAGPRVTSQTPAGNVAPGQAFMQFTFNEPMDTSSFSVAADVVSFTGPGAVDLKSQITGFTWPDSQTLKVQFNSQTAVGAYTMVIGPNITDDGPSFNPMNQDGDSINGEVPDDRYSGSFTIISSLYVANMTPIRAGRWTRARPHILWQYGTPTGSGGDPSSAHSGANVNRLQPQRAVCQQHVGDAVCHHARVQHRRLHHIKLGYWRWLGVESSSYDHASVQVWDGSTWTTLWANSTTSIADTAWSYQEYALPTSANNNSQVKIRWGMGTTDGSVTYCGWNIDDVTVTGTSIVHSGGPAVTGQTPTGSSPPGRLMCSFTFSEPMDTSSFAVAADVVSFTGPGGVDVKSQITGFTWPDSQTLKVQFNAHDGRRGLHHW